MRKILNIVINVCFQLHHLKNFDLYFHGKKYFHIPMFCTSCYLNLWSVFNLWWLQYWLWSLLFVSFWMVVGYNNFRITQINFRKLKMIQVSLNIKENNCILLIHEFIQFLRNMIIKKKVLELCVQQSLKYFVKVVWWHL